MVLAKPEGRTLRFVVVMGISSFTFVENKFAGYPKRMQQERLSSMRFLYNNIAVVHVFAVLAAFAWLFGGVKPEYSLPVMPWITALLLEVMVCFPQHHDGETTYEARERVWESMRRDPIVWMSLAFILLLLIPFVNTGLCPICDYPAIQAGQNPNPIIPFIPFCVNRAEHLAVVMWFVPTLMAVVATKHALLKRGKRMLLELVVWNGVALGVIGALQQMTGAEGPLWFEACKQKAYFFSTFGYANMAGDYFTTLFGISIALWRWKLEEAEVDRESLAGSASASNNARSADAASAGAHRHHRHHHGISGPKKASMFWKRHYFLIPAFIFFCCAMDTLSRAAIMLITAMALILALHSFICFFAKMKKAQRVRAALLSLFVLLSIAISAMMFMPKDIQREVDTIDTVGVLDRVTGKAQYHTRVATEIWKDNFLFGVGGKGYKHFCVQYMTDKELRNIQIFGGVNVHNDYLQFLTEHGLVGFGLLVAIVVALLWPLGSIWRLLVDSVRFVPTKDQPPQPVQIFVIPAPVFCILMTALATFIHGFADCPLRSPAILSLFFVSLACIDGFLPHLRQEHHRHHRTAGSSKPTAVENDIASTAVGQTADSKPINP